MPRPNASVTALRRTMQQQLAIGKALTVSAHKFSAGARAAIEAAGGRCEVIPR